MGGLAYLAGRCNAFLKLGFCLFLSGIPWAVGQSGVRCGSQISCKLPVFPRRPICSRIAIVLVSSTGEPCDTMGFWEPLPVSSLHPACLFPGIAPKWSWSRGRLLRGRGVQKVTTASVGFFIPRHPRGLRGRVWADR